METDRDLLLQELTFEHRLAEIRARTSTADLIPPNAKQWEFINSQKRFTMIRGLNRGGKSTANLLKNGWHLTGRYPPGFTGPKHDHPIILILAGETGQTTRDLLINRLLGPPHARGTGFIPGECFDEDTNIARLGGGVTDQVDYFKIRHETDGIYDGLSIAYCFAYATNWRRMMGYQAHRVMLDEEPAFEILDELQARLLDTMGYIDLSNTAQRGYTEVMKRFEENKGDNYAIIDYGLNDATHWSEKKKQEALNTFGGTSMEMPRLWGPPVRGVGIIYPIDDSRILVDPIPIPTHWKLIIGVDFPHTRGHFACVKLAYDQANDTIYLVDEYKGEGQETAVYIGRLKAMGGDVIPVAWPHDGAREVSAGATIAETYRRAGCNMLPTHAQTFDIEGRSSNTILPTIQDLSERMNDGRFKVFRTCPAYVKEKRTYQQKDGTPLKHQDNHIIDAKHKARMMLDYAVAPGSRETEIPMLAKLRSRLRDYDAFG